MSSDNRRRETMEFRYEPSIDSPDAVLLRFLKNGTSVRGGKDLILQSVRAYWMAIAYQQSEEPERATALALECCQALREQIRYLEMHFGLMTVNPSAPVESDRQPNGMPSRNAISASRNSAGIAALPSEVKETESDHYGLGMQATAQERRSFL